MDQCLMTNFKFATGITVLLCALFGIYTFHAKITCRSSMNRKKCVRQSFLFTVGILGVTAAVLTLYYIHTNRQNEMNAMVDDIDV
jgi:hypothetical protein